MEEAKTRREVVGVGAKMPIVLMNAAYLYFLVCPLSICWFRGQALWDRGLSSCFVTRRVLGPEWGF